MAAARRHSADGNRADVAAGQRERYPSVASKYFGECYPHRLRWAHAVNSRLRLRDALASSAHFLEADVAVGMWLGDSSSPATARQRPRVRCEDGAAVITAHYPTESKSDLCLEELVRMVISHNERVAAAQAELEARAEDGRRPDGLRPPPTRAPPLGEQGAPPPGVQRVEGVQGVESGEAEKTATAAEEAVAFSDRLDAELEADTSGVGFAACVGRDRRPPRSDLKEPSTYKGLKLDFKQIEAVLPALRFLHEENVAHKLGGHLWLNADVFAGPGALLSPLDARNFVSRCAEVLPEAVLSLSWGTTVLSTTRLYTNDMVERMVELCMSPFVPSSPSVADRSGCAEQTDGEILLTPAAVCKHITFAVAAEYALSSSTGLRRLLNEVPGTSLTVFSGVGSMSLPPYFVRDLITTYGKAQLFLDLKLGKPWRGCGNNISNCALQ